MRLFSDRATGIKARFRYCACNLKLFLKAPRFIKIWDHLPLALPLFVPTLAVAADLEANLSSLVTAMTRKIFPLLGIYYAAEVAFLFVQGNPDAPRRLKVVAVGFVALIGINGAWAWLNGLIK